MTYTHLCDSNGRGPKFRNRVKYSCGNASGQGVKVSITSGHHRLTSTHSLHLPSPYSHPRFSVPSGCYFLWGRFKEKFYTACYLLSI